LNSHIQSHQVLLARLQRAHPGAVLRQMQQRVDELTRQLAKALQTSMLNRQILHQRAVQRLLNAAPRARLQSNAHGLSNLRLRLGNAMEQQLQKARARLSLVAGELAAVSPLATLERGYAVVRSPANGAVLSDASKVHSGDQIEIHLARGLLEAKVIKAHEK
jgi:exodeoxyribonuclease VII large subunit